MAGNKEAFQKAMNQGHSAAWDQEWEKAADFYSAALEEFPDHAQALSSLGLALFEMQDYPSALQCYKRAASLSPDDPVGQEKIARIYERMGKLNDAISTSLQAAELHLKARAVDKAIDNWVRVLSLTPENIAVRSKLAAVYEKLGRKDDAATEYIATASIFQHSGDLTRALKVIERAFQAMPDHQEIRMALSMLRSNQTLPRPSRPRGGTGPVRMAQLREMEDTGDSSGLDGSIPPDPICEARQKAMIQLAAQLFDQAEEGATAAVSVRGRGLNALARGIAGESDSGDRTRIVLHLSQAIDSQTMGDNDQAVIELEKALNLGLRQPSAYFALGLMLKDNNSERAQRYLQQSVKHPDFMLASYLLIGAIYEKSAMWQEAASAYLQSLALADSQVAGGDPEELISQYDPLIDSQSSIEDPAILSATCKTIANQLVRPDWRAYLLKTRQHLPSQPDGTSPIPVAELVLETRGSNVVETMARVRQLATEGKVRTALEEAMYAIQQSPSYLPLHVLVGELMLQEDHMAEAINKFQVVTRLYNVRGETNRAVRMLKRISQINPTDLAIRQQIIDLLVAQDKIEDALLEYTDLADLFYRLAELDKARQTYLDALKVAQKSKDNRTWGVNVLMKVADIDLQRLNLRQALRIFEQIRTIQPDLPQVRAQLVTLNFRLGQEQPAMKELDDYVNTLESAGRRKEAIDFVNDLLIDQGSRLDVRRRLADLMIRNGQVEEAVAQLDTVADGLLNEGKHLEAINMIELIISLKPANVEDYKQALDDMRRSTLRK